MPSRTEENVSHASRAIFQHRRWKYLAAVGAAVGLMVCAGSGCSSDVSSSGDLDADGDLGAETQDASTDEDVRDTDVVTGDLGPGEEPFDEAKWEASVDCGPAVDPETLDADYAVPDGQDAPAPWTEASVYAYFGADLVNELPVSDILVTAAPTLRPGHEDPYLLYGQPGGDVILHFAIINRVASEDRSLLTTTLSFLVDYEPVDARFIRWGAEREEILDQSSGTSARFPVTRSIELVDVVIPAESVEESRFYELAGTVQTTGPGWDNVRRRRYALFNGSLDRAPHGCFAAPLDDYPELVERRLSGGFGGAILFTRQAHDPVDLEEPIVVQPGESLDFFVSFPEWSRAHEIVARPHVDGHPLSPSWSFVTAPSGLDTDNHIPGTGPAPPPIDARRTFGWRAPDRAGEHVVEVVGWPDAFSIARHPVTFERMTNDWGARISTGGFVSNRVRLLVGDGAAE